MSSRIQILLFCFLLPALGFGQQTQTNPHKQTQTQTQTQTAATFLRVSGTSNLKDPLTEMGKFFEKSNPAFHVDVDSLQPAEMTDQVTTRAPVDVIVGLSKKELEDMQAKNLILPGSISKIVSDEVVIVAPPDSALEIKEPKDLVPADLKQVALLKASGGLGKASREYLTKTGVIASLTDKIVEIKSIREGFQKMKAGQAQWMFAYSSNAVDTTKSKIIWRVPQSDIPADEFYAAVPLSSTQPDASKKFIEVLHSTIARMIFKNEGFLVAETQPQTRPVRPRQQQTQTQPAQPRHEHKKKKKKTKKPPAP